MKNKESYTHKEVEEMLRVNGKYNYKLAIYENTPYLGEGVINKLVDDCEHKIPKSLIDKLKIKKKLPGSY